MNTQWRILKHFCFSFAPLREEDDTLDKSPAAVRANVWRKTEKESSPAQTVYLHHEFMHSKQNNETNQKTCTEHVSNEELSDQIDFEIKLRSVQTAYLCIRCDTAVSVDSLALITPW